VGPTGAPPTATVAPPGENQVVESPAVRFAAAVRTIAVEARRLGVVAPSFRSPPKLPGVDRSLRRWPGGATVAVVVRGRPWPAVMADMVEGVVATNRLAGAEADRVRAALWATLDGDERQAA
jgi:hypothetical protein